MNSSLRVVRSIFRRKRRHPAPTAPVVHDDLELRGADAERRDAILRSGLFDPGFYDAAHPDTLGFPGGGLRHFVLHGADEGREASPRFDSAAYLADHPEPTVSGTAPFLDAIARYDSQTLFDRWPATDHVSFAHMLRTSGLFDPDWYIAAYRDVAAAGTDPFDHFANQGAHELRNPGPDFDSILYRYTYPDFRLTGRSPIESYLRHGRYAGRETKGANLYALWVRHFDTLEPEDLARVRAQARTGPVVGILIVDRAAAADFAPVLRAWTDQCAAGWSTRFVRSGDLDDAAWAACRAAIEARPDARACTPDEAGAGLADGTAIVLGIGAALLRPHAASLFADALMRERAVAAYADHDRIDAQGRRSGPCFKPAMSPEFMRRLPYAGPIVAAAAGPGLRAALARAAADAGTAWADLLLGADPGRVARVPFVLYHVAGAAAPDAPFEPVPPPGGAHHPPVELDPAPPRVAVIIPTRDHGDLVQACIESIERASDYPANRLRIVIVDNGTTDPDTLALFEEYRRRPGFTLVPVDEAFNFSKLCNAGAQASEADILVFLNNDTTVHRADWLKRLVAQSIKPGAGFVGAQLLYPDGTVQHGGVVLGVQGVGAHRLVGIDAADAATIDVTREMTSLTGACLAVRREVFETLGGFDPVLRVAFNDVDLCARAVEAGYRNVYVAEPLLIHHESKSRGFDLTRAAKHRNLREGIYARERHGRLFRADPSYSQNLSLIQVGALAFPPRAVRPWRRSAEGTRRILLLSVVHGLGHGVATVVAEQAAHLIARGWEVAVGGPPAAREIAYPGCRRVHLWDAQDAAAYAVAEGVDCVMAHTPPFFSVVRHLGPWPLAYFTDHGEPMPHLFDDREAREEVDWEKRFCAPLAHRVFTISRAIHAQQYRRDAIVVRNGNSHLARWSEAHAADRTAIRTRLGFADRFVVLNVCRFGIGERRYKGIDAYAALASDLRYLHPELADRVVFVLAGRGDPEDVAYARSVGLTVHANVTDAALIDLYVAADLYLNLSTWEGYNLGIGQALAMGLDVLASDIEAHREFGVETSNSVPELCASVARRAAAGDGHASGRRAVIQPWSEPLTRMAETIEADLAASGDDWRM